ncbi:MAG: hypothetical protein IBX68_03585 [Dehalococcoidia bacterium]|nr:hypothetical protein [Dehalococcoidia bacterium]
MNDDQLSKRPGSGRSTALKWVYLAIRRATFRIPEVEYPSTVLKKMSMPPVKDEKRNGNARRLALGGENSVKTSRSWLGRLRHAVLQRRKTTY